MGCQALHSTNAWAHLSAQSSSTKTFLDQPLYPLQSDHINSKTLASNPEASPNDEARQRSSSEAVDAYSHGQADLLSFDDLLFEDEDQMHATADEEDDEEDEARKEAVRVAMIGVPAVTNRPASSDEVDEPRDPGGGLDHHRSLHSEDSLEITRRLSDEPRAPDYWLEDKPGVAGTAVRDGDDPLLVNPKQYHRIVKRRAARARLEEMGRLSRERKVGHLYCLAASRLETEMLNC